MRKYLHIFCTSNSPSLLSYEYFDGFAATMMMIQLVLIANLYASLFATIIIIIIFVGPDWTLSLSDQSLLFYFSLFLTANSLPCVLTFSAFYIF